MRDTWKSPLRIGVTIGIFVSWSAFALNGADNFAILMTLGLSIALGSMILFLEGEE